MRITFKQFLLPVVASFALLGMSACEFDKELSPEQMCQELVKCGDPVYNDAFQCAQIVNDELRNYPECDLTYENLLESRLDYFCAGDEDEIHFFDNHESLLLSCHETHDEFEQIENEFDSDYGFDDDDEEPYDYEFNADDVFDDDL